MRFIGIAIICGSLYYLGHRLSINLREFANFELHWTTVLIACVGVLGYALALLLVVGAWGVLLSGAMTERPCWSDILAIYGRSQVLKYIPSNVMHFAGRQVLGGKLGWPQLTIGTASFLEIVVQIAAAALIAIVLGWSDLELLLPYVPPSLLVAVLPFVLLAMWFVLYIAPKIPTVKDRVRLPDFRDLAHGHHLPAALSFQVAFQLCCGTLLWTLVASVDGNWDWRELPAICAAFSAAWVIGLISPGVSAGIGVREAILVVLLGPIHGELTTMAATLAMRFVTTLGDLLLFGAALSVKGRVASDEVVQTTNVPTPRP